jgi:hypothetical protein
MAIHKGHASNIFLVYVIYNHDKMLVKLLTTKYIK